MDSAQKLLLFITIHQLVFRSSLLAMLVVMICSRRSNFLGRKPRRDTIRYSLIRRIPKQIRHLDRLLNTGDIRCKDILRMNRSCFMKLCHLLRTHGGLEETKYVGISEMDAMFLDVLAHHTKNRKVGLYYRRSGETVSKCFNRVLVAVLRLHPILLVSPDPVTVEDNDYTWKKIQGCLGALDGTYVDVRVPIADKPRYRSRKGAIATNVLAVCDRDRSFVYVLSGWEGSAADSRVLKDAIHRNNGFKVPHNMYYLCDNGYTNGAGFLTPYRGVRYHLKEWESGRRAPQTHQEYFNMKHSKARNIIERTFGVLKQRWAILRSNSFFPVKTQNHIIMSCVLLHNYIRRENGPHGDDDIILPNEETDNYDGELDADYIDVVAPSDAWTAFRDTMAENMYNDWRSRR